MPQSMAGRTECHEVFGLVASPLLSCHDVMHFQEPGSAATGGLATVLIACQNLLAHPRGDCGRVAASVFTDRGVAAHSFGLGPTQLAFTRVGVDGHSACFCVFVDLDLDGGTAGKVPPGGPRLCSFMTFNYCIGFVRDFFNLHTCFNFYTCRSFDACRYSHACHYFHTCHSFHLFRNFHLPNFHQGQRLRDHGQCVAGHGIGSVGGGRRTGNGLPALDHGQHQRLLVLPGFGPIHSTPAQTLASPCPQLLVLSWASTICAEDWSPF